MAGAERAPDGHGRRGHRPLPLRQGFLSIPLQLRPQPCFSLVAQMRPWWSPVSLVPASDTHSTPEAPLSLTSAPSSPHQLTSPNLLPTVAKNHL